MDALSRAVTRRVPLSSLCTKALRLQNARRFATTTDIPPPNNDPIKAAQPFSFVDEQGQGIQNEHSEPRQPFSRPPQSPSNTDSELQRTRVVPASRAYFSSTPQFIDDTLALDALARKVRLETLPVVPAADVPKTAWKSLSEYQMLHPQRERVKMGRYRVQILNVVARMNALPRSLMSVEVQAAIERYMRLVQPAINTAKPAELDKHGRARGVGRRKASSAVVYLVEGTGECLINGKNLTEAFGRVHHRESAIWPLKVTERLDKYNVWATCQGGGCTGQAEALMLGLAKALLIHEPALKPALRRCKCHPPIVSPLSRLIYGKLTSRLSRRRHSRLPQSRAQEGWQAQGPQNARLGQALSTKYIPPLYISMYARHGLPAVSFIVPRVQATQLLHSTGFSEVGRLFLNSLPACLPGPDASQIERKRHQLFRAQQCKALFICIINHLGLLAECHPGYCDVA